MATRDYATDAITVHWDSEVCRHSGICASTLPAVFRPREKPWIVLSEASADEVASTVALCPSGALRYTRTSRTGADDASDPFEAPPPSELSTDAVTVTVHRNGPYEVRGASHVVGSDGSALRDSSRVVYLCRCGGSGTKPFCDGSHNRNGFTDDGLGPTPG